MTTTVTLVGLDFGTTTSSVIVERVEQILKHQTAGNRLEALLKR
jgi:hypothetical protein